MGTTPDEGQNEPYPCLSLTKKYSLQTGTSPSISTFHVYLLTYNISLSIWSLEFGNCYYFLCYSGNHSIFRKMQTIKLPILCHPSKYSGKPHNVKSIIVICIIPEVTIPFFCAVKTQQNRPIWNSQLSQVNWAYWI